jgi:hypothetical protein
VRVALVAIFSCISACAQSINVYSEFAEINSNGVVTAPANPREILSPAIVRNGFTSFQVVVKVAPETPYWLYVGENPEDAVRVTLYRKSGEKMEPVELPYEGKSTQIFWLDLWTGRDAPVRRVKIEPQLKIDRDWLTYPMEVRVLDAVVPDSTPPSALCSAERTRDFSFRNVMQDAKLATLLPKSDVEKLKSQCPASSPSGAAYSESYLRIRDYLFRMR